MVLRTDLEMSTGKLAAQACHASLGASEEMRKRSPGIWRSWQDEGGRKIVVAVPSKNALMEIARAAGKLRIGKYLVKDRGLTEIPPGTVTALGLGPEEARKLDKVTGTLPLLK
jgi:PTH2 family peptidyl-tRNA hydrolase